MSTRPVSVFLRDAVACAMPATLPHAFENFSEFIGCLVTQGLGSTRELASYDYYYLGTDEPDFDTVALTEEQRLKGTANLSCIDAGGFIIGKRRAAGGAGGLGSTGRLVEGGASSGGGVAAAAAAAEAGVHPEMASLLAIVTRLEAAAATVTKYAATPSVAFSKVSPRHFTALVGARGIRTMCASLPDLQAFWLPAPVAFVWPADSDENKSADDLTKLLNAWVQSDKTVDEQRSFVDIHSDRSRLYTCEEPGVGKFTGVPDVLILGDGLGPGGDVLFACDAIIDWKTPGALAGDKQLIARQGGVLAVAAAGDEDNGPPVFFTDMSSGMRCFIVIDGVLVHFHRDKKDLTLREGVALIRYFLFHRGTVDDAHRHELRRIRSRDDDGGARSLGRGGAAATGSAALAASATEGGGAVAGSGTPVGASGSRRKMEANSRKSSPGDPREFALDYVRYLEVAVEEVVRGID